MAARSHLARRRGVGLVAAALAVATTLAAVPAGPVGAAATGCPEVVPVHEVARGMVGEGRTVSRGTTIEPFTAEVVGVLRDGLAPDVDLILVQTTSPEIDRVGGIWAGMSGSPIYIGDRLLGSVSYGFTFGPSKLAGVTPAEAMVALADTGTTGDTMPAKIAVPAGAAPQVKAGSTMSPLPLPLGISGLAPSRLAAVNEALGAKGMPLLAVPMGSAPASAAVSPAAVAGLEPGSSFAASLSYGDVTAAAVGTTTLRCDDLAVSFGHPFLFDGATEIGANTADVVAVADDPTATPYKLANIGGLVGTVDQDRLAGIRARLGDVPAVVPIRSSVSSLITGRSRDGRTNVVLREALADLVLFHLWTNWDLSVHDEPFVAGVSSVGWTITGRTSDGERWSVSRANRHADPFDLSTASILELYASLLAIGTNPFDEVLIDSVEYDGVTEAPFRELTFVPDEVELSYDGDFFFPMVPPIFVEPGNLLHVRVPLHRFRSEEPEIVELRLRVPDDATPGFGTLRVRGGQGTIDPLICLFDPQACASDAAGSFQDVLDGIADAPHNDELVVTLTHEGFAPPGEPEPEPEPGGLGAKNGVPPPGTVVLAEARLPLDEVVRGEATFPVELPPPPPLCPPDAVAPFTDLDPASPHTFAVHCVWWLGISGGVSLEPPLFGPERDVTRGQLATFLLRFLETAGVEVPPVPHTPPFEDIAGSPHADAISRLSTIGVVTGTTPTTFGPDQPTRRDQAASMLLRALERAIGEPVPPALGHHFADVDPASPHAGAIDALVELGVVFGRAVDVFDPGGTLRRDAAASILVRALLLQEAYQPPVG